MRINYKPSIILIDHRILSLDNVVSKMYDDLEGHLVKVKIDNNNMIDPKLLQGALDTGNNVVVEVDFGLTAQSRKIFSQTFTIIKASLINNPRLVCVIVDIFQNICDNGGICPDIEIQEGTVFPKDKEMIRKLKSSINRLNKLNDQQVIESLQQYGRENSSFADIHSILVMESIVILLSPESKFLYPPERIVGLSWKQTQNLLLHANDLVTTLSSVDATCIPEENLDVLQTYINHECWDHTKRMQSGYSGIIILTEWVESVVEFAILLRDGGGGSCECI